jgi:hypothetical protein
MLTPCTLILLAIGATASRCVPELYHHSEESTKGPCRCHMVALA